MKLVTDVSGLRSYLNRARSEGKSIGFVPTMGNLHAGHLDLVRASSAACDVTVVSIFVNPMQFGPNEDFDAYPRTLDADSEKLKDEAVDVLFAPTVREMYPSGVDTQISVPSLSNILCGASRPGHFTGVATVVAKLFNIVQPTQAFFGKKDFQQLAVIRQMVSDLVMPLTVVGVPTGRAEDGLALSSRNAYLTASERDVAPQLYRTLLKTREALEGGNLDLIALQNTALESLTQAGFRPDYFEIRCAENLTAPGVNKHWVILAAAYLGKARLIDNLEVEIP